MDALSKRKFLLKFYGLHIVPYYIANYIFDYLMFLTFAGPYCLCIAYVFKSYEDLRAVLISDILIFGISVIPYMYVLSFIF